MTSVSFFRYCSFLESLSLSLARSLSLSHDKRVSLIVGLKCGIHFQTK